MVKVRQLNAWWAARSRSALDAGARGTVIGLQLRGMTADLARGFLVSMAAWSVFSPVMGMALSQWTIDMRMTRAITVAVATSVAAAAVWKIFHASHIARWLFLAGLGISITVSALR